MIGTSMRPLVSAKWIGVLVVLVSGAIPALGGFDPTLTVTENGKTIGTITINIQNNGTNNAAVSGNFTVTAKDPSTGNPFTMAALAQSLGEDHFNWLQDFTQTTDVTITSLTGNVNNPKNGMDTTPRTYKAGQSIIDPQSGGQSFDGKTGQWADALPWYFDEPPLPASVTPPNTITTGTAPNTITWQGSNIFELSTNTKGSMLDYFDRPGDKNLTLNFTTFLVSVGPGNTYNPIAGFTWTDKFDASGNGTVTLPTLADGTLKPATFTADVDTEINSQGFGRWTAVPGPSPLVLLATGLIGALPFGIARRFQYKRMAAAA